ncbi:dephospho-CoA kinase [mine drainage metagenome]|uniref:Dephospho-CoA kinase n=1 Tax=mine drainage metagenome TaxID=410659 RepID=T0ZZC5_9ZZZZ
MAKKVIVVTGMPGAGKDEFISVAKDIGFADFHMGNTVRKFAMVAGILSTDSGIGDFASRERVEKRKDIWARRTIETIQDSNRTIIDGLRNQEELDYFKSVEGHVFVVAVFANRQTRLERILKRNRPDDVRNLQELIERDNRELSWGIAKAIVLADYLIVNDTTLEHFRDQSLRLLHDISNLSW